jgi:hypothetical protein
VRVARGPLRPAGAVREQPPHRDGPRIGTSLRLQLLLARCGSSLVRMHQSGHQPGCFRSGPLSAIDPLRATAHALLLDDALGRACAPPCGCRAGDAAAPGVADAARFLVTVQAVLGAPSGPLAVGASTALVRWRDPPGTWLSEGLPPLTGAESVMLGRPRILRLAAGVVAHPCGA